MQLLSDVASQPSDDFFSVRAATHPPTLPQQNSYHPPSSSSAGAFLPSSLHRPMDDASAPSSTLGLACPYHWYCGRRIWRSADDVNDHLAAAHAGTYALSWAGVAGLGTEVQVSRGSLGSLKCKWKGCGSSVTGSIHSLLDHLKIEHGVEATYEARSVPTLPWPPVNADDLLKWGQKRAPKAAVREELPPSQSLGAPSNQLEEGIRSSHAVGRLPSPQPSVSAMDDQAGLRSAPALSQQLRQSATTTTTQDSVLPDLRHQQRPPLLSQRSETQAQQRGSSSRKIVPLRLTAPPRFHGPPSDLRTSQSPSPLPNPPPPSLRSQPRPLSERPRAAPSAPSLAAAGRYSSPANDSESLSLSPTAVSFNDASPFDGVRLRQDRSPSSPVHGGSGKRARLESPPCSPRVASFMTTPSKGGADFPASGPTMQGMASGELGSTSGSHPPPPPSASSRRPSAPPPAPAPPAPPPAPAPPAPPPAPPPPPPQPTQGTTVSNGVYTSDLLRRCGSVFDPDEGVVICLQCKSGYLLQTALIHARDKHKWPPLSTAEKKELEQDLIERGAAQKKADLRERKFRSLPVEGIASFDGFACDRCRKGWIARDDAVEHCKLEHDGNNAFFTECKVQSILKPKFRRGGVHWVRVVPGTSRDPADTHTAYQATWAQGVALLAKLTGWLDHLALYIPTEDGVAGLKSLTDLVAGLPRHPDFALLPQVIDECSNRSCALVHDMEPHVRYMLTESPRTRETDYFNLPSVATRNRYRNTLTAFAFALLTSTDTDKTPY
ncbi:hypothetical protein C8J57DRAFT_1523323 [Mycena rebaudengoi]|nr:hypothetical protein C8J57DRAFT_1523323 [Mycena rebaudengoi]